MEEPLTAEQQKWRAGWLASAQHVFEWAGFHAAKYQEIQNEYCPASCRCGICAAYPWLLITTPRGVFRFGWRKRVIVLDWSSTDIEARAEVLFEDQDVTKGARMIHCYGYAKALDYLRKLIP